MDLISLEEERRIIPVSGDYYRSNGSVYSFDFNSLIDWTQLNSGVGTSSTEIFDSRTTVKLEGNPPATSSASYAQIYNKTANLPQQCAVSFVVYNDLLLDVTGGRLDIQLTDNTIRCYAALMSDGIYMYNGSFNKIAGITVELGVWTEWGFDIDFTAQTIDIYKNGVLVAAGITIFLNSTTLRDMTFTQLGYYVTASPLTYLDHIWVGSAMEAI